MRVSKAVMSVNAMLYLGGVVGSSIADISRPSFHWGLRRHAGALLEYASMFNTPEFRALTKEARETWGAAISMFNSERLFNMYQFGGELGPSQVEKGIQFMADQMGWLTGIDFWTSANKEIAMYVGLTSVLEIAEKLRAGGAKTLEDALSIGIRQGDITQIANMGLGIDDLVKVAEQVSQHGEHYERLMLPKTDRWTDADIRAKFEAAMVKEIDATINTPSLGDKPLWTHNGILQHAAQFRSYAFNTMRATLIKGILQDSGPALQGALLSAALGAACYVMKQAESGREITDNEGEFLMNAIDRGGLTSYYMDIDSMIHRLTKGNISVQALIGGEGATRFAAKSDWEILGGPTTGTLGYIKGLAWDTIPGLVSGEMNKAGITPLFRLIPYNKAPWWRWALERTRASWLDEVSQSLGE
jgi:hypothetical protein